MQNARSAQQIATHVSMGKHARSVLTPSISTTELAWRLAQRGIVALARDHWAALARHAKPVAKHVPARLHAQSAQMLCTSAVANVGPRAQPQPIRRASNELGAHANHAVCIATTAPTPTHARGARTQSTSPKANVNLLVAHPNTLVLAQKHWAGLARLTRCISLTGSGDPKWYKIGHRGLQHTWYKNGVSMVFKLFIRSEHGPFKHHFYNMCFGAP